MITRQRRRQKKRGEKEGSKLHYLYSAHSVRSAEDKTLAEIGIRLVSYGNTIQFSIEAIGYKDPYLIIFYGHLEDGSLIQLIQHVSQISFVLIALKRSDPEKPKAPIGFITE